MYQLILYCHKETEIGDTMLVKVQSDKCFNHILFNFSLTKLKAKKIYGPNKNCLLENI